MQEARDRKLGFRLMFQDEARFGRISDPRACWVPIEIGRPVSAKQIIREYTYAYGAVSPQDGHFDSLILPTMDAGAMSVFLKEIFKRYPSEYILMIADGASCHKSKDLVIPNNIKLLPLPPYSPILNPQENIWDEMREKWFGNCVFRDMDAVEERMISALLALEKDHQLVKSITGWDWILNAL